MGEDLFMKHSEELKESAFMTLQNIALNEKFLQLKLVYVEESFASNVVLVVISKQT